MGRNTRRKEPTALWWTPRSSYKANIRIYILRLNNSKTIQLSYAKQFNAVHRLGGARYLICYRINRNCWYWRECASLSLTVWHADDISRWPVEQGRVAVKVSCAGCFENSKAVVRKLSESRSWQTDECFRSDLASMSWGFSSWGWAGSALIAQPNLSFLGAGAMQIPQIFSGSQLTVLPTWFVWRHSCGEGARTKRRVSKELLGNPRYLKAMMLSLV